MATTSLKKMKRRRGRVQAWVRTRHVERTAYFHLYRLLRWYVDARLTTRWKKEGHRLPGHALLIVLGRRFFSYRTPFARVYDKRTGRQTGVVFPTRSQMHVFIDIDNTNDTH